MGVHIVIPAAGSGRRMGADRNKLLLPLLGEPVLAWTLKAIAQVPEVAGVCLVGQPVDFADLLAIATPIHIATGLAIDIVAGGATRQASVQQGLESLVGRNVQRVLIHDGARCLATPALFERCHRALHQVAGLVAAIPVKDTIKHVAPAPTSNQDLAGFSVMATPPREQLWAAQTPQGFRFEAILAAYRQAMDWPATDDASVFEHAGQTVHIVPGEETNLKITTPADLAIATWVLQQRLEHS